MVTPPWLANGEFGLECAVGYKDKLFDLALTAVYANRWLDNTRVVGNYENEEIARRTLALMRSVVDVRQLVPPVGAMLEPIRAATIRLAGLV